MKGVVRLGDLCDGHMGGCDQRSANTASEDVFVNGKGVVRIGDLWEIHCSDPPHPGTQATGSGSVFVNGKGLARIDDLISCGAINEEGSDNVFAGD